MAIQGALRDLAELSRYHAAVRGERVAMTFEGRETTYGQLDRRASRVANGLRATCTSAQARVALLDKNSDQFFELLFGAAKARDVLVPVNWRLAPAEIAYILNDAEAELLVVGEEYVGLVEELRSELRTVEQIVALGGGHSEWEGYTAWRDRQASTDPRLETPGDDVALQHYTSGTTGHPKGTEITHNNLFAALAAAREWYDCSAEGVNLARMPQYHIAGSLVGMIGIYRGARTVITRQVDTTEILRLIPAERVTHAFFAPAVLLFLLQTSGCREMDFSSLEYILYGASPIPLDLLREALATFKCDFGQAYGLTETTGVVTVLPPEYHDLAGSPRMRSCGKPLSNAQIKVVDAAGGGLPSGQVGEIVVRTPQVMKGYWRLKEATATTIRDGWLHTGDAGYFDEDGYLYVYDRLKDMIISGGENVYPAEVESVLFGHPAVADVAVIGVPDERWGEAVKAIVVRKPGGEVDGAELIAYARERIAHYKAPKSVDFVEALPRNPSGKILKRVLRAPYWEGRERQVN
jgi:acyl-CoA synthetase (AMP-forming)/AMP-acid ligase II